MIAWPVSDLLPHAGAAILIDEVLSFDEERLSAQATVRPDGLYSEPDGAQPSWVGIEIMAQAVAAWAGCQARMHGRRVALGFLLGTRRYACAWTSFPPGLRLRVDVERSLHAESGIGLFECHLRHAGTRLAHARLTVYQPPDAAAFLPIPRPIRRKRHRFDAMDTTTILITGSSRGIGHAIALALARAGHDIVIHCRNRREQAESAARDVVALGRRARILQFDVGQRDATRVALEADITAHGAYYGVVLNAGLARDGAFPALSQDDWDTVLRTNLDGFYNVLHPVVMPMIRRRAAGRIVCMTSVSGLIGNRGQVNYSASKAGLIGASKALAVELAKRQITVNCVAPGLIDTDMIDTHVPVDEILKAIPAQRAGTPEDVAAAVVFLMPAAGYITRQVLAVNGGLC